MSPAFQHDQFYKICKDLLQVFPCASICQPAGEILFTQAQTWTDLTSLSHSAQVAHQYLQLKDGEIAILNDPYSGGSTLNSITLIMAMHIPRGTHQRSRKTNSGADILIASRVYFPASEFSFTSIEEEGVRIPPTPILSQGQLNQDLLNILCAHPKSHPRLATSIQQEIDKLQNVRLNLLQTLPHLNFEPFTKQWIKTYLDASFEKTKSLMSHLSLGEVRSELELETGEKFILRLETQDGRIFFDFTGTPDSPHWHLTDQATLGVCIGATLSILKTHIPLNSGSIKLFELSAPIGSAVNAKYPAPVYLGMTDGTSLLTSLIGKALGLIDSRLERAQSAIGHGTLFFKFATPLIESLGHGRAARPGQHGPSGCFPWSYSPYRSLEQQEQDFPVKIHSISLREKSGGSGKWTGGSGVTKVIEINQPTELQWCLCSPLHKPEGIQGGKVGSKSELYIQKKGQEEKIKQGPYGQCQLDSGDCLIFHSGGGGGCGS